MIFLATKQHVGNHGAPPDSFLAELVAFGKSAPNEIFAPNSVNDEIYARIRPMLGPMFWPWTDLMGRRAAMLETLRVLAAFESSWNWNEGADKSAGPESLTEEETGAWQVSANSLEFGEDLVKCFEHAAGYGSSHDPRAFISEMKANHQLAIEYAARLLRHTVEANGPVLRNEITPWLSRSAAAEFQALIVPRFS